MLNTISASASALLLALAGGNVGPVLTDAPATGSTDTSVTADAPAQATAGAATTGAAADTATETAPQAVETHTFSGSSTDAAAFQKWFAGADYEKPSVETRDLVQLSVPGGETAQAGDTIAQLADGSFAVIR